MDFSDLVSIVAPLVGTIIGGVITFLGVKVAISAEYRLKKEEVNREKADFRIKNLYKPLLNLMSPPPPYDGLCFESEICKDVVDLVEKNEIYASSDLLKVFWEFRVVYYNGTKSQDGLSNIGFELYDKAYDEYEELKSILGYGPILKRPSILRSSLKKIRLCIESIVKKIKRGIWKINRKRRLSQKPREYIK